MSFTFRGANISLDKVCLVLNGSNCMEAVKDRFDFHPTTRNYFNFKIGQDLCHRYSFSSMQKLLCLIYNSGKYGKLEPLISTLFPYEDNDRQNAFEVYKNIIFPATTINMRIMYFNELLYILNNSIVNLRPGNSSWNRSIGECYDPAAWSFTDGKFVITDEIDVFILSNLLQIKVNPSTIYFYTAKDSNGNPMLYSSNNISVNEGIGNYQPLNIPIYIYPLTESGEQFEMRVS